MNVVCKSLLDVSAVALDRLIGDAFFASRVFAGLWRAKGGDPVAWCADRGGEVLAVLPGVVFGRDPVRRFMSMPDGCYGGVFVAPEAEALRPQLTRALLDAVARAGYLKTWLFDFDGHLGDDERFTVETLRTSLVDISVPGWEPPDKKLLSQIRKAERDGIEIQSLDWGRHRREFMRLMEMTEKRHGNEARYDEAFFSGLAAVAAVDSRVRWIWCEHEGRGACSHIYVVERGMLQGWQIYFDKAFSFLKPNQYIRYHMCREIAPRGIRYLNLGGSPENAPGLQYYKSRWGGRPVEYRMLSLKRGVGKWI